MNIDILTPTLEEYKNMLEAFRHIQNPSEAQKKTIYDLEKYIKSQECKNGEVQQ